MHIFFGYLIDNLYYFVSTPILPEYYQISIIRLGLAESHRPGPSGEVTVSADTEHPQALVYLQPGLRPHPVCDLWAVCCAGENLGIGDVWDIFFFFFTRTTEIFESENDVV